MNEGARPNPDALLAAIEAEKKGQKGKLRLFFGMAAGVGKTFAMLKAAQDRLRAGVDVVVGVVETHQRAETAALLQGLSLIPKKNIEYRGTLLEEMDLEGILKRKPQLVLVDELAHTNAPGSRHPKRYQDVIEILEAGIDVYSTMNVQHLESRVDMVQLITAVNVRETVPDSVLDLADQIELIDISPHELLKRFREGKIYGRERADRAMEHFFQESHLTALREIALRATADRVDQELQGIMVRGNLEGWTTDERLLVAISPSPFSERLIRTARRMAVQLETSWVALYVDTGGALSEEDQNRLVKHIELARELGAEVITTQDHDVVAAIQRVARSKNVIQVVIGRPERKFIRDVFLGGSLLDRLVRESRDIDVHVIREPQGKKKPFRFIPSLPREAVWGSYLKTLLVILLVTSGLWFLNPLLGYRAVGIIYLLAVIGIGLFVTLGPTLFAAGLSALLWNFLFIPPVFTFSIHQTEDAMLFLTYFVAAFVTGIFAFRLRRQQRALRQREEKTNILYEILKAMTLARGVEAVVNVALARLEALFAAHCGVLTADNLVKADGPAYGNLTLNDKERAVAAWSFENGKVAGWSTDTLPMASSLAISLKLGDRKYGVLLFQPNERRELTPDQENLLFIVANQIAIALAKEDFEDERNRARLLEDSERLHQTLLNSISHELRTPLTAIVGAASALQNERTAQDPKALRTLTEEMITSSDRLNRVFENLLDMTRLESGMLKLNTEWFDLSELVTHVLGRLRRPLSQHRIMWSAPSEPIYVEGDFHLLEHVFDNILLNAVNYAPAGSQIQICVEQNGEYAVVRVGDSGPGIAVEYRERIFEKFYRVPGSPAGGTGLGLSLSKSLVEAHGGRIEVQKSSLGGAEFRISLPARDAPRIVLESSR